METLPNQLFFLSLRLWELVLIFQVQSWKRAAYFVLNYLLLYTQTKVLQRSSLFRMGNGIRCRIKLYDYPNSGGEEDHELTFAGSSVPSPVVDLSLIGIQRSVYLVTIHFLMIIIKYITYCCFTLDQSLTIFVGTLCQKSDNIMS